MADPLAVAIIPCFNEEDSIAVLVRRIRRFAPEVLVVDDGSSDSTSARARAAGAEVLRRPSNLGKGSALRHGWEWAFQRGFQWALCLDGDGQHAPEDIPAFFECRNRTGAALVVGNRTGNPDAMPRLRRMINSWMSRRISALAGQPLPDSQCGFRLIELPRWAEAMVAANHFEVESDLIWRFARAKLRIEFVPIRVIYAAERSKIRPVRDSARWFRWYFRARREQYREQANRRLGGSNSGLPRGSTARDALHDGYATR